MPTHSLKSLGNKGNAVANRPFPKHASVQQSGFNLLNTQRKPRNHHGQPMTTIQMGGHAEDLCILKNVIVKRADKTEIGQYLKGEVPGTAPGFRGPYYTAEEALNYLSIIGETVSPEKKEKIILMAAPMKPGGRGFLMLENVTAGMSFPKMRDLKLGEYTADEDDQRRHGESGVGLSFKMERHDIMDKQSGSRERGYRDEDQWQKKWTGDNLSELKQMLEKSNPFVLEDIMKNLLQLMEWIESSKVVYVGMSVLVVSGGNQGKAVPIDFEHPIRYGEKSFEMHQAGLIHGLRSLFLLVKEMLLTYQERSAMEERQRQVRAEMDRQQRFFAIRQGGGSINRNDEGNEGIGNDDL